MEDNNLVSEEVVNYQGIEAVVKWFNQDKGFGFVEPVNNIGDAFVHISAVKNIGYSSLIEGALVNCDLVKGPKGVQVKTINSVQGNDIEILGGKEEVFGIVKFYNYEKGFGFVVPEIESGEEEAHDIYISKNALERSNIESLETAQKVKVITGMGSKGLVAESIEIIEEA